jgi:hypothetical protein
MANFFALVLLISLLALPVGLVNPTLFQGVTKKVLGKDATRKNLAGSFSALALVSFVGIGLTAPTPVKNLEVEDQSVESSEEVPLVEAAEPAMRKVLEENTKVEVQPETASSGEDVEESVTVVEPESAAPAPVYEEPDPAPAPAPTSWYSCSSNVYNCSDFSTHAEAQTVYEGCLMQAGYDVHDLDGNDKDGLACESLP